MVVKHNICRRFEPRQLFSAATRSATSLLLRRSVRRLRLMTPRCNYHHNASLRVSPQDYHPSIRIEKKNSKSKVSRTRAHRKIHTSQRISLIIKQCNDYKKRYVQNRIFFYGTAYTTETSTYVSKRRSISDGFFPFFTNNAYHFLLIMRFDGR